MVRRSTWILLGVFIIVLGVAWYIQRPKEGVSGEPTPTQSFQNAFQFTETEIASLRIEDHQGNVMVLGRDQEGLWSVLEPQGGATDAGEAESGITSLATLRFQSITNPNSDLSVYGLTVPSRTVTIALSGGEKHTMLVGDLAPTGDNYYVQIDGGSPVIIANYSLDPFLKMLENPPFQATETPTPGPTSTGEATPTNNGTKPAQDTPPS
jgi:hypothetical protein